SAEQTCFSPPKVYAHQCGSEESTHCSGIAPDEAKFMPHRKRRGSTRRPRQRSACDSFNYGRRTLCCDGGGGYLCPVKNRWPVLKVGRWTLGGNSAGRPTLEKVRGNRRRCTSDIASRRDRMPTPVDHFRHRATTQRFLHEAVDLTSCM